MNKEEIDKLQFPCLLQHKPTEMVVLMDSINGTCGNGIVRHSGTSAHKVGTHSSSWNTRAFYELDNNNLYGYVP